MTIREIKREIVKHLELRDCEEDFAGIRHFPVKKVINVLFSFLYNTDETVKMRSVSAMGAAVARLAASDMEYARIVMRRLIWNLNDESGGIGWGSPEAMGEIMARCTRLAREYHKILLSYINITKGGNFLEHPVLQKGVLWGIGRLGHINPDLLRDNASILIPWLKSHDSGMRGLAAWSSVLFYHDGMGEILEGFKNDKAKFRLYVDGLFKEFTIAGIVNTQGIPNQDSEV